MPIRQIITGQKTTPAKLACAIELRREMTRAERALRARLQAGRLAGYHFRRQQGVEPTIVDFYCHQAGLIIEVDGGGHLDQQEQDRQRDQFLIRRGMRILRFWNSEIKDNMEGVLLKILRSCQPAPGEKQNTEE